MLFNVKIGQKSLIFSPKLAKKGNFSENAAKKNLKNSKATSGPNFSSKGPVEFSNCGGKCRKMKYVRIIKM